MPTLFRYALSLIVALTLTTPAALAQSASSIAPYAAGNLPIACTDVEMDYSKLPAGVSAEQSWRGEGAYVTNLFTWPTTASAGPLRFSATMPNNPSIFKRFPGKSLDYAAIACYPTSANNPRADYRLPNGLTVPKMQRGSDLPIFGDETKRYPMIVLSHGLGGAPIDGDYLLVAQRFAAEGYIVVMPFHADQRFSAVGLGSFGAVMTLLTEFPLLAETMAIRPVGISATLDVMLSHPSFKNHIDTNLIGGWGASLGGQALMLNQGARLTTSIGGGDGETVITDKRIKAIVGYVPYSGYSYNRLFSLASFGEHNEGVRGIRTPYMAIVGADDDVAPQDQTISMVEKLSGSRYLISIAGLGHTFIPAHAPDIFTWSLLFYKAHLFGDATARDITLKPLRSVGGVASDSTLISVTQPWWFQDEVTVTEYYHSGIKHYFLTGIENEKLMLDNNRATWGWMRTGESFLAWRSGSTTASPVFRFYHDANGVGVNTHFYTLNVPEANSLRIRPQDWREEQSGWQALPFANACASDFAPLSRAYNNRFTYADSNHRFMTNTALPATMRGLGWVLEGDVMCIIKP